MKRRPRNYWTLEKCKSEASKYKFVSEFRKMSAGCYNKVQKSGLYDEICAHMIRRYRKWNFKTIRKEALKYKTRSEFQQNNGRGYVVSLKNGWDSKIFSHMKILGHKFKRGLYAFEFIDKSVYIGLTYNYNQRYDDHKLRSKWYKNKKILKIKYDFIKFNKFYHIDEVGGKEKELIEKYKNKGWTILNKNKAGSLGGNVRIWTVKKIQKEALKYKTRTQFAKNGRGAYSSARNKKIVDKVCKHMPEVARRSYKWTFHALQKEALNYKTRSEFKQNNQGGYSAACKRKFLNEICSHMPRYIRTGNNGSKIRRKNYNENQI